MACLMKPFILVVSLCLFSLPAYSSIINVPEHYSTIQGAINASNEGDEIIVSPGNYVENILIDKDLILRSTKPNNLDVVKSTIINGREGGITVSFGGDESSACVLSGFKITNGSGNLGAGIYGGFWNFYNKSYQGTHATIKNNFIINNTAYDICYYSRTLGWICYDGYGAGIFGCMGIIENNIILSNSADQGGGLCCCQGEIRNNIIYRNFATHKGGGIIDSSNIKNNIIWGNYLSSLLGESDPQISNSYNVTYCCIQNGYGGRRNISSNPLFVDSENGNFHLQPNSPCIDAGAYISDSTYDFDGEERGIHVFNHERGDGSGFDMGIDEFIPIGEIVLNANPLEGPSPLEVSLISEATASEGWIANYRWIYNVGVSSDLIYVSDISISIATNYTYMNPGMYNVEFWIEDNSERSQMQMQPITVWTPIPADFNRDLMVNIYDLFLFSQYWHEPLNETNFICNPNEDGIIDEDDLFYLINGWSEK